jgi:hypothetical protein
VYDVAAKAGYPNDVGLVGRLDALTSGIILFTNDTCLNSAISVPVTPDSPLALSSFKCKEYFLRLLSKGALPLPTVRTSTQLAQALNSSIFTCYLFRPSTPREQSLPLSAARKVGHDPAKAHEFDTQGLEKEMSQPFTFQRYKNTYSCDAPADLKILKRYQDMSLSRGRDNLGWCLDVRVVLREGKHHQIRRIARRSGYMVASLHRVRIAGILSVDSIPVPGQCRWLTEDEIVTLYEGLQLDTSVLYTMLRGEDENGDATAEDVGKNK